MASEMLSPGFKYLGTKVLITYDTDDSKLTKDNTTAEAKRVPDDGVQFEFTANRPGKRYSHTSGVIPSKAVRINNTKPTRNVDGGNVNALYDIEVIDQPAFESNF